MIILPFRLEHQNGIDQMMERIALEFEEPIFSVHSKQIADFYTSAAHQFWVAIAGAKVVGTIGLVKLSNKNIVLKSMFVDRSKRGKGLSQSLLEMLSHWARQRGYEQIWLGTMAQFIVAQRFYEKQGFKKCEPKELPIDFVRNEVDTVFYSKELG